MKHETKFKETEIGKIPEDWEIKDLSELSCEKNQGVNTATEKVKYSKSGIVVIRAKNIFQNYIDFSDVTFVDDKTFESVRSQCKPINKDILFTNIGSQFGNAALVNANFPFLIAWNVLRIRPNTNLVDNKFLSNLLNYSKPRIKLLNASSTMPFVSGSVLDKLNFAIPKLEEQRAIAKILSDLDAKIELNQQMNKTLEEIAKAIFKQWFVDFEFPNEQGNPYKSFGGELIESELGLIPKGWEVGKLKDLGSIQPGFAFKSIDFVNAGVGLIKIKNIDKSGTINLNFESYISNELFNKTPNKFYLDSGDVIIAMTGAELGKTGIIPRINNKLLLNQRVGKVVSNYKYLFYQYLNSDSLQSLFNGIASASSAQGNISNTDIESVDVILPTNNHLLKLFEQSISDLYLRYIENLGENINLIQIRDTLLPKLMSGEIRVDY
jgi:type I restriction enzyme S subunit